jgi:aryl-alcohol dehydrogenase-like predicted oxidoreductase
MKEKSKHFKICTKLPAMINSTEKLQVIKYYIKESLYNLDLSSIDFYLSRNFNDLLNIGDEIDHFNKLKSEHIIRKLSISIYDIKELEYMVNGACSYIDLV